MEFERYRVRILDGSRVIFLAVSQDTALRIIPRLEDIGARVIGPSAWSIDGNVEIEQIMAAIEELPDEEVVYLVGNGTGRPEFSFIVAPKRGTGIRIIDRKT